MAADLMQLPNAGAYRCVLADPPWSFVTRSAKGQTVKSPSHHYSVMSLDDIRALPVGTVAARDSFLALWVTWPFLPAGLDLIKAWGFTYSSGGAWAKQSRTGKSWAFGTGYRFRSASEVLLLASRGSPKWLSRSERNLWVAPIRSHSQKPEEVRDMLRRATEGPRLELFANDVSPGFDAWGDGHERKL